MEASSIDFKSIDDGGTSNPVLEDIDKTNKFLDSSCNPVLIKNQAKAGPRDINDANVGIVIEIPTVPHGEGTGENIKNIIKNYTGGLTPYQKSNMALSICVNKYYTSSKKGDDTAASKKVKDEISKYKPRASEAIPRLNIFGRIWPLNGDRVDQTTIPYGHLRHEIATHVGTKVMIKDLEEKATEKATAKATVKATVDDDKATVDDNDDNALVGESNAVRNKRPVYHRSADPDIIVNNTEAESKAVAKPEAETENQARYTTEQKLLDTEVPTLITGGYNLSLPPNTEMFNIPNAQIKLTFIKKFQECLGILNQQEHKLREELRKLSPYSIYYAEPSTYHTNFDGERNNLDDNSIVSGYLDRDATNSKGYPEGGGSQEGLGLAKAFFQHAAQVKKGRAMYISGLAVNTDGTRFLQKENKEPQDISKAIADIIGAHNGKGKVDETALKKALAKALPGIAQSHYDIDNTVSRYINYNPAAIAKQDSIRTNIATITKSAIDDTVTAIWEAAKNTKQ